MERYGMLTFVETAGTNRHGKSLWRMRCTCGKDAVVIASQVKSGHTKSCGCARHHGNNRTHGKRKTREYTIWCNIKARCQNPKHPSFHNYGGRGISLCEQWESFETFLADVGTAPTTKHTLDRIDNNAGYMPANVRWATRVTQTRNMRVNVNVCIDGAVKCLHDWCKLYGISAGAVYRRMGKGESVVSAITRPKAARFI